MKEKCRRAEHLVHTHAKIKIHFLNPWAQIGQPEKKGTHTSRTQLVFLISYSSSASFKFSLSRSEFFAFLCPLQRERQEGKWSPIGCCSYPSSSCNTFCLFGGKIVRRGERGGPISLKLPFEICHFCLQGNALICSLIWKHHPHCSFLLF